MFVAPKTADDLAERQQSAGHLKADCEKWRKETAPKRPKHNNTTDTHLQSLYVSAGM